ncbi:unnamed protein product [Ostreobium quekettii]|uniref:Uncharacterized protein n=1 Tax=Ostreobium quekettii TaxID=121088 RepID=A0A8S1JFD8_9CHLO|nr:unnamed protein product [Ostreobium quekettii]
MVQNCCLQLRCIWNLLPMLVLGTLNALWILARMPRRCFGHLPCWSYRLLAWARFDKLAPSRIQYIDSLANRDSFERCLHCAEHCAQMLCVIWCKLRPHCSPGDSGAPLLRLFAPGGDVTRGNPSLDVAVAIAAFRDPEAECIDARIPYAFTGLRYFRDWIDKHMKGESTTLPELGPHTTLEEQRVSRLSLSEKERQKVDKKLWDASVEGDVEAVIEALDDGAAVDVTFGRFGEKPLHVAASNGHSNVVRVLLAANADVDATKRTGTTALFVAAQNGHVGVVLALLAVDADYTKARPSDGSTPLYKGAENGHLDVVLALLEAGADPNRADHLGDAPLHISSAAVGAPSEDITNALLNSGADIDARGIAGLTPLMRAAYYGNLGVMKLLVNRGADVSLRSDNAFDAEQWVCWCLNDKEDQTLVQCTPGGCEQPDTVLAIEALFG